MNSSRPNIVVILSDQHNARLMGCAGDRVVRTPNLDKLAAEGINFGRAYCPHPLCVPSRMGFLTGRHPGEVNVWSNSSSLASDIPTFAHALGGAGYEAVLCGRMHFYDPDQFHGFEKRLVGDCWGYLNAEILGQGQNRTNGQTRYAIEVSGYGQAGYEVFDNDVTEAAIAFIEERDPESRPYCMVVGYMLPHNPFICSKELFDCYMDILPEPPALTEEVMGQLHPAIRKWIERRGVHKLTPEQNHRARAAYHGLVTTMDRNIGKVVEAVRQSSGAEDTVILYCSDHGDQAGEHGMWWKSSFYDGSVRVPMIASWPGRFPAGVQLDSVVNLIDVAPTLLELADANPLPDVSGRSLVPMLRTGCAPEAWQNETFSEFSGAHGDPPSAMLLSWPWKLIYYSEFDSCMLFNLDDDPGEMDDCATDSACEPIRRELLTRLRQRWSAERIAEGAARARRNHGFVQSCGHDLIPHGCPRQTVPEDANRFDITQVPHLDEIQKRRECGEK